jgi:hypothetical protein
VHKARAAFGVIFIDPPATLETSLQVSAATFLANAAAMFRFRAFRVFRG